MKKGWKIFWIICGGCMGVGLICCMAALIMGVTIETIENRFPYGFSFPFHTSYIGRYVDDDYEEREDVSVTEGDDMQKFKNVRSIDMYVAAGEVEVRRTADTADEIIIETEKIDKRLKLQYYMDGDELVIQTKKKITHINNAGGVGKIYINIPERCVLEDAEFNLLAGSLYVEEISAKELSIDVGAGEASINKFTADKADFNCGTGSIMAAGNVREEADIDCGIGQITFHVQGKQTDYNYEVSCGIGEVSCGDSTYSGIGSKREVDNHATKEMEIDCGIGNVIVNFSDEL